MNERAELQNILEGIDSHASDLAVRVASRPCEGRLFGRLHEAGLQDLDVILLFVALAARLGGQATLSGSDLVSRSSADSATRLAALGRLSAEGLLVSGGFLVPEVVACHGPEAHKTTWRLGESVFRRACDVFAPRSAAGTAPGEARPYRTNEEVLADVRRLSLLYRQRAARIFHLDPWSGTGLEARDGTAALVLQAQVATRYVSERLAASESVDRIPLLKLRAEQGLDLDALVILVTVLFQELVEGVGAVDAVDLVKLVSESEGEVLRRRSLLRPLHRKGLLLLEGAYGGKDLTADASLPNDVVETMLGDVGAIASDERIDFHDYLQRLESSETFFSDLGPDEEIR
jgi:hypothetical protein